MNVLKKLEERVQVLEEHKKQPELREDVFPVGVKITQGVISYKHPNMERWTRGKSLGSSYELAAIEKTLQQNHKRSQKEYDRGSR